MDNSRTYQIEVADNGWVVVQAKDFVQGFESLKEALDYIAYSEKEIAVEQL